MSHTSCSCRSSSTAKVWSSLWDSCWHQCLWQWVYNSVSHHKLCDLSVCSIFELSVCLSVRPGPRSSLKQVDAGQTSGFHVSPLLLSLPVLLLPDRVQHFHLCQPANLPGRLIDVHTLTHVHTYTHTHWCTHSLILKLKLCLQGIPRWCFPKLINSKNEVLIPFNTSLIFTQFVPREEIPLCSFF